MKPNSKLQNLINSDPRFSPEISKGLIGNVLDAPFSYKAMTTPGSTFTLSEPNKHEHALLAYALHAHKAHIEETRNTVYEGTENCLVNYKQIFLTVCQIYDVKPDETLNAWFVLETSAGPLGLDFINTFPTRIKFPLKNGGIKQEAKKSYEN